MKRKISLVIAFFVSFLLIFSIAMADGTKLPTVTASEPIEVKVAKIPRDTNKADSPPQVKAKVPVIDKPIFGGGCVLCEGGWGHEFVTGGRVYCSRDCN
ncbi:MAG: hypothetical protein ICV78_23600 [Tolypothrix sp. Co-bin9]|nr:hypothetical protein [Tolypothrix sp. Co-bin9]